MKMLLTLVKVSLNVNLGISLLKYRFTKEKKKLWEPILFIIAALFGIGSLVLIFSIFMVGSFYIFSKNGQSPETIIAISFLGAQFFLLFFGIFHILSAFYFSKDMDILMPLPLKPYQVLGSKFITIMVNEYLITIPMVTPAIVIYGVGMQEDIFYWFKGIISILLLPVIPLIISSLFVIVLMRFINIKKSKDIMVVVMSFIGLGAGLGINFFLQKTMRNEQTDFSSIAEVQRWLIESIGTRFPPSIWATFGLSREGFEGWGYFIVFVFTSILLFAVLLWIGNQVFYKGMMRGEDISRKRKTLSSHVARQKNMKVMTPLAALFWREWKLLLRTPVFMLNGLAGVIMMPIMALMSIFVQEESSISQVLEISRDPKYSVYVSLIGLFLMIITSSMNIVSSTALSREGHSFWISKMIPITPKQQIMSKFLHGMAISVMGILLIGALMVGLLKYPVLKLPVLFIVATAGTMVITLLDLLIDVIHPKLDWTSPHEAVKTNLNGLFGMVVSVVFMVFLGFFTIVLFLFNLPTWIIYFSLFIFNCVMIVLGGLLLFNLCEKRYRDIEI